jgi:hypothetical protein
METKTSLRVIKLPDYFGYPVLVRPESLLQNCMYALDWVNNNLGPVRFAGMGTSGAMILATLSALDVENKHGVILLSKTRENTHRNELHGSKYSGDYRFLPIVVVDDQMCTGATMKNIKDRLMSYDSEYPNQVKAVLINNGDVERHQEKLRTLFPMLEHVFGDQSW